MGVKDLWKLLEPAGRPVNMESLAGTVLAVDVSIWLNQAVKGMRDRHGNAVSQAHLVVLFNRVCKLLHYKIKPVFVFDGATPSLKKHTLAERARRRVRATDRSLRATDKQVTKFLQSKILEQVYGNSACSAPQSVPGPADMYDLAPLPDDALTKSPETSDASTYTTDHTHQMTSVDIHSEDFACLPPEVQHELLLERQQTETHTHHDPATLPQVASDFSSYQLTKLMTQSRTTRKLEDVRKVLKSNETAVMGLNDAAHIHEVETSRILSSEDAHYILVRGKEMDSQSSQDEDDMEGSWIDDLTGGRKEEVVDLTGGREEGVDDLTEADNLNRGRKGEQNDAEDSKEEENVLSESWKEVATVTDGSKEGSDVVTGHTVCALSGVNSGLIEEWTQEIAAEIAEEITQELTKSEPESVVCDNTEEIPLAEEITQELKKSEPVCESTEGTSQSSSQPIASASETVDQPPIVLTQDQPPEENTTVQTQTLNRKSLFARHSKSRAISRAISAAVLQSSQSQIISVAPGKDASHDTQNSPTQTNSQSPRQPTVLPSQEPSESSSSEDEWREVRTLSPSKAQERLREEAREWERERGRQSRAAAAVSNVMYKEAQELLRLFGLPHLVAPGEAEAQCAYLETSEQVEGSITDDNDVLLFGGRCVYRGFFSQDREPEVYKISDVQDRLGLSREQLVVLSYLLGCDYTAGLEGVGVVSAMELLRDFPGERLEPLNKLRDWHREALSKPALVKQANGVLKKLIKTPLPTKFPDEAVYKAYILPEVDSSSEQFEWGKPDLDLLRQFAHDKMNWDQAKVDSLLLPLLKRMNSEHKPITHYFSRPLVPQEPQPQQGRKIKSRRVRNVVARLTNKEATPGSKRSRGSCTSPHKPSKQPRLSQKAQAQMNTISASSSDSD